VSSDTLTTPLPANAVPSLDDLVRITARNERVVVRGVDWAYYERLLEVVGVHSRIRLAYDGRDLEIMSPGALHEAVGEFSEGLVQTIAEEVGISCSSVTLTTWTRPEIKRGIDADRCFYFLPEKLAQHAVALKRNSGDAALYPEPDLAIEIDLPPPKVDRPGIYAALGVTEIWRFGSSVLQIERLKESSGYESVAASGFLPISGNEIVRWVCEEDRSDASSWNSRLRAWIRAELASRRPFQA
jgi:Uma2 family endonuclease